jgi:hypothetical protein
MQHIRAGARDRRSGNELLFAVVAVVSIVVCSAVGVFAWRTVSPDRTLPGIDTADPAVGYAFYSALEAALNGGETAPLHAIVTNDFVDHDSATGATLGFDELTAERGPETQSSAPPGGTFMRYNQASVGPPTYDVVEPDANVVACSG